MASKRYDRPTARKARPPRRLTWKAKLYRAARRKDPWFTGSNESATGQKFLKVAAPDMRILYWSQSYRNTTVQMYDATAGRMDG